MIGPGNDNARIDKGPSRSPEQNYEMGYNDGLQEGERRGWEAGKEAAAGKIEQIRDEAHRGRAGDAGGRWKAGSSGAEWCLHNIMVAAIRKLKKP